MKKIIALILAALLMLSLAACSDTAPEGQTSSSGNEAATAAVDREIEAEEATGAFDLKTEDGAFTVSGNVYTITAAGTYTASGRLEGQIVIDAGKADEVVLELSGATIVSDADSPVKVLSAGNVDISAKKGTENVIRDERSVKTADGEDQGEGAIYAECDLKIKGSGTLVVEAKYNNGIHTTKDLKIQKLTMKVNAVNTALKGNDSILISSGTIVAISTNGDSVKTENTDVNKNGVTRGDVTVSGGSVTVYAAGDGFQAARNFELFAGEDGAPEVTIYTGSYSGYTASDAATTSYKGVKVQNELNISAGTLTLQTYDDGLHADYGAALGDGTTGQGAIRISGGTVTMNVYAPENKTAGGRKGPGGWGGQQSVIGADAIHADHTLTISGGTVSIDSAYEGLEANVIVISGGETTVAANDDGVNACKGNETPAVQVTGGYLDVSVSPSGDTDGIDSNGIYVQTGGVVIARGSSNMNMAAIDADGSVTVNGGTLIVLGYGKVSVGSGVSTYNLSLHSAGAHQVTVDGQTYAFTNAESYGSTACYSSVPVSE